MDTYSKAKQNLLEAINKKAPSMQDFSLYTVISIEDEDIKKLLSKEQTLRLMGEDANFSCLPATDSGILSYQDLIIKKTKTDHVNLVKALDERTKNIADLQQAYINELHKEAIEEFGDMKLNDPQIKSIIDIVTRSTKIVNNEFKQEFMSFYESYATINRLATTKD